MRALRELTDAARSFEHDPDVSAVILTGTDQLFSLGADLRDPELQRSRTGRLSERRLASQTGGKMCRAWEEVEPLTIVAIEGWCVGVGSVGGGRAGGECGCEGEGRACAVAGSGRGAGGERRASGRGGKARCGS